MKHHPSSARAARRAEPTTRETASVEEAGSTQAATTDDRQDEQIRLAACFLYQQRDCVAGHELEDWLEAEAQVVRAAADDTTDAK